MTGEQERSLGATFLKDLKDDNGVLHKLLNRVKKDVTLDMQFRGKYINIYYRGGSILRVDKSDDCYKASIDMKYFEDGDLKRAIQSLSEKPITMQDEVQKWIDYFPLIKQARDFHYSKKNSAEREFQQLVVRSNNYERTAKSTDFFITDMEYSDIGKIDLVALEITKNTPQSLETNFAFIEMKFGNSAVGGESGLEKHLTDINDFVSKHNDSYLGLVADTELVFKQKLELNLYNFSKANESKVINVVNKCKPYFVILLADYKNSRDNLIGLIEGIKEKSFCAIDIKFSVANFMGYGLYSDCMYSKDEILKRLKK